MFDNTFLWVYTKYRIKKGAGMASHLKVKVKQKKRGET